MSMLKKNWQKDAGEIGLQAALRAGGAGVSAFILNKFFNGEPRDGADKKAASNTAITMRNIAGPVMLAVGVLGDMMMADDKVRAMFQGVATYSALHSVAVIAPDLSKNIGVAESTSQRQAVSGLGQLPQKSAINALGTTTKVSQQPIGRIPRHDRQPLGATNENYNGNYPEEFALAAGQKTVVDTDGKTFNNDWAYLAQNIDQADQISKTIGELDDEEAAKLMGVPTAEEAAQLLGMF